MIPLWLIYAASFFCLAVFSFLFLILLIDLWNAFGWHRIRWSYAARLKRTIPDRFQLCFLAGATCAALQALYFYKEQSTFQMLSSLEQRDQTARSLYVSGGGNNNPNDGPVWSGKDLLKIFADEPPNVSVNTDAECNASIRKTIKDWEGDYFKKASGGFDPGPWATIPQLYNAIWSSKNVLDNRSTLARVLVMHTIDYVYVVHDALRAKQLGFFSDDEYSMWRAYLDDLTPSPFYLLALRDGVEYRYMMSSVVQDLREFYKQEDQAEARCIINTVYPGFWTDGVGALEQAHLH